MDGFHALHFYAGKTHFRTAVGQFLNIVKTENLLLAHRLRPAQTQWLLAELNRHDPGTTGQRWRQQQCSPAHVKSATQEALTMGYSGLGLLVDSRLENNVTRDEETGLTVLAQRLPLAVLCTHPFASQTEKLFLAHTHYFKTGKIVQIAPLPPGSTRIP